MKKYLICLLSFSLVLVMKYDVYAGLVNSNLYARWHIGSLSGLSDGDPVTNWENSGGNVAFNLTPYLEGTPTYSTDGFNGKPSVYFSDDTQMLATGTNFGLSGDPAFTVFFTGIILELNYEYNTPWVWGDGSAWPGLGGAYLNIEKYNERVNLATGWFEDAVTPVGSFTNKLGKPTIITVRKTPGSLNTTTNIFIDGVSLPISGSSNTPDYQDKPFFIGKSQFGGHTPVMEVTDVIVYNRSLSDFEIQQNETYLEDLYAIPIPPTMVLLGTGLISLLGFRRFFYLWR